MANADKRPTQAASGRASDQAADSRDTADVEGPEVVSAVSDVESDVNKSTALLDKEARMRAELEAAEGPKEDAPRGSVWGDAVDGQGNVLSPYAVEGNDGSAYVGVNPEYATYANDTEKPLRAEEGTAERYFEDQLTQPRAYAVGAAPESNQTEGGGSSVPLLYPDVSGSNYVNEPVKVTDAPVGEDVSNPDLKGASPEALGDPAPRGDSKTRTRDGAVPSEKAPASEF